MALLLAAGGCTSVVPRPGEPELREARRRDPEASLEQLDRGRTLYVNNCSGCHPLYPVARYDDETWPEQVAAMVDLSGISREEEELIVLYLVSSNDPPGADRDR